MQMPIISHLNLKALLYLESDPTIPIKFMSCLLNTRMAPWYSHDGCWQDIRHMLYVHIPDWMIQSPSSQIVSLCFAWARARSPWMRQKFQRMRRSGWGPFEWWDRPRQYRLHAFVHVSLGHKNISHLVVFSSGSVIFQHLFYGSNEIQCLVFLSVGWNSWSDEVAICSGRSWISGSDCGIVTIHAQRFMVCDGWGTWATK